jgi:hypothetical protein
MQLKHWQDYVTAIVGIWLMVSPYFLAAPSGNITTGLGMAGWNAVACGGAVLILAAAAIWAFRTWEEWVTAVIGLWLIASPWLLGYSQQAGYVASAVICGVLLTVMGFWAALKNGQETYI